MSIQVKSDEEKVIKEKQKEGVDRIKKKYMKRWNLEESEKFHMRNTDAKINFPTSLEEVDIGEVWEDNKTGKKWKRTGKKSWTRESSMNLFRPDVCMKCERLLSNHNEINVNMTTGRCYKCHAKEETEKIAKGEEYVPPSWKSEIRITNTFGEVIMDIYEYINDFGELNAYIFLTNLIDGLDQKREKGKRVNEPMYENAVFIRNKIKQERLEDISVLEDIISDFKEEGIIKNKILNKEVHQLTEEFHKRKGNAKELELIKQTKKDIRKLI